VTSPAFAQQCGPTASVEQELAARHNEAVIFTGLRSAHEMVRLWLNPDTGSWTATVTTPGGQTCVVSNGLYGDPGPLPKPKRDDQPARSD
jgi:hypothetical protein